ncbi:MAG: hypothetical protein CMP40_03550 [Rickettsiales bacterium]|nr:hypothetical protein [Rickettsiales bacterium]|tara:strand:+ start:1963 stop:2223 length:261 start_codon:yes stop_codon:yes gene_type:complete
MTFMKKNIPFKRNNPKPLKRNNHKNLNGFDNKVSRQRPKGNPLEVKGKYESLAKDASSAGDRIAAENYMQHAEHFLRVNNALKKSD